MGRVRNLIPSYDYNITFNSRHEQILSITVRAISEVKSIVDHDYHPCNLLYYMRAVLLRRKRRFTVHFIALYYT